MDKYLSKVLIGKVRKFLEPLSQKQDEWRKKFFPQLLSSIVWSGGLVVTEMARYVAEVGGKSLEAGWQQIREHLRSRMWSRWEAEAHKQYARGLIQQMGGRIQVVVDLSDVSKPHAQKMEWLDIVRDADESSLRGYTVTNPGYWEFESYVLRGSHDNPVPLTQRTYSIDDPTIGSENKMYEQELGRIAEVAPGAEVILDRGGDRPYIINACTGLGLGLIVRQTGLRTVYDREGNRLGTAKEVAKRHELPYRMNLKVWHKHRWVERAIQFGLIPMRYAECDLDLFLVIVRFAYGGQWSEPMTLLTDRNLGGAWEAFEVIRSYTKRWRAEDGIRFLKSALGLETIRLKDFRSIQRLIGCTFLILALLSLTLSELSSRHKEQISEAARSLRTPILLFHYRLLEVLKLIFLGPAWRRFLLSRACS